MTSGELQSLITLAAFVTFMGIVVWAWSSRRRDAFGEAARIPLDDDAPYVPGATGKPSPPAVDRTDANGPTTVASTGELR